MNATNQAIKLSRFLLDIRQNPGMQNMHVARYMRALRERAADHAATCPSCGAPMGHPCEDDR